MKKNIAIIGASYLQMPLIEKAKEMGYVTHVFAWAADDYGERAADFFYPISIIEKEQIAEKCKEIGIVGICSIASDLACVTVNYVADKLGLVGNSLECTQNSTNKYLMRQIFEKNGDPSPKSIVFDDQMDINSLCLNYPLIVKPTDRSGSRGVRKLENDENLKEAISNAIALSFEKKCVVEEFVEGDEYSVEGITYNGKHHILAITKKYTTGAPNFIETAHIEPAPLEIGIKKRIIEVVTHALDSLGIKNSASHSEIKIDRNGRIKIIEIGGRMGGDCIGSDLVKYSTGIDYVKAVIQVACGEEPDLSVVGETFPVKVKFIFSMDDYNEYERIKKERPETLIKTVYMKLGLLDHITDSSTRAGCYITRIGAGENSEKKDIVIFGANDLGRLLKYYIDNDSDGRRIVAYTMNQKYIEEDVFLGLPVVPFETIQDTYDPDKYEILIAIGNKNMNDIRKKIFFECKEKGYTVASYYHSSCSIHSTDIGEGNILLENCLVYPFAKIGDGNLLWDHVLISHDCIVGDFNTFSSYADLCGYVTIGNNGYFGKHCIINEHSVIADYTLVGANAYAKKETQPYDVVVPARSIILDNKKSTDLM